MPVEAVEPWNEPNNLSRWDFQIERALSDAVTGGARRPVGVLDPAPPRGISPSVDGRGRMTRRYAR